MFNLNRNLTRMRQRNGISIIEVLTSMAVATIGVFGIMVMIPFAVKQSQLGLDSDAAHNLGRNALEEIQISGLFQVGDDGDFDRLVVLAAADGAALFPHPSQAVRTMQRLGTEDLDTNHRAPGVFHLDPIGFAAGLGSFEIPEFLPTDPDPGAPIEILSASVARNSDIDLDVDGLADFDNTAPNDLPSRFRLDDTTITALTRSQIPFTAIEADRLFRSNDDLFFQNEPTGVEVYAPPQPLYNIDNAGNRVRRQTGGRISWSAFLVPEKDSLLPGAPATQFRANILVYSDRFLAPPTPADPEATVDSNYGFYLVADTPGYNQSVSQVMMDPDLPRIPDDTIFRGDWVMLVNRIAEADGASTREWPALSNNFHRSADEGHRLQFMFAKVSRVNPDGMSISIDGGSFDFVTSGVPSPGGGLIPPPSSRTYMVHLKNVVNVFERSISIE